MPSCFIHILAGCGINLGLQGLEELISGISVVDLNGISEALFTIIRLLKQVRGS